MMPVHFKGAHEIKKPEDMTDEQCTSIWAKCGLQALKQVFKDGATSVPPAVYDSIGADKFSFFLTAWRPNKEDLEALNRGEPIYVKTVANGLPPMALFTLDQNGEVNQ
jgi:hypothetical protein